MPLKRQFLYYQLLKFSGAHASCDNPLDQAVDQLCSAPNAELAGISLGVQLDALLRISQAVSVLSTPEVAQLCLGVDYALERGENSAFTSGLLGRALEAAGVAFAINNFTERYRSYTESRLYRTQGLKHLLASQGIQVLQYVSTSINKFEGLFVKQSLQLGARLRALSTLKHDHPEVYAVFTKRRKAAECKVQQDTLRRCRTLSLSLDEELETAVAAAVVKLVPCRRAFSVEVQAGLEAVEPPGSG